MSKLVMAYTFRARVAVYLAVVLTALCFFARPVADCVSGAAPYCAAEKIAMATPGVIPPAAAMPAAISTVGFILTGVFLLFRPDLRIRIPVSAQVTRVPWRDRFLPYTVAIRDP